MKKPVQRDPTQKKGQDSVGKVGYAALHIIPTEFPYPRPERYQARPPRVLRLPVLGALCGVCWWGGHRPPGLQSEATGGTHGFQHGSWHPPPISGSQAPHWSRGALLGLLWGLKPRTGSQKHAVPIQAPSPNASLGQPYCLRDDCGCLSRGSFPQSWPSAPTFREREAVLSVETT